MAEIFDIKKSSDSQGSQQIQDDFASGTYELHGLVQYPDGVTPLHFKQAAKRSSIIPQCVEAYKRNITGYGVTLEYIDGENDDTAKAEWDRADEFLKICNMEKPIEQFLADIVEDIGYCNNAYVEVVQSAYMPTIYRMPPDYVRATGANAEQSIQYTRLINGEVKNYSQPRKVRKYAQKIGGNIKWFKEFGASGEGNEVIHLKLGNETYGEPKWIGNAPNVTGDRESDEFNMQYFENGRFMPILLNVVNGELTADSVEMLKNAKGKSTQGAFLYLQTIANGLEMNDTTKKVSLQIEKLSDMFQQDALFLGYKDKVHAQILSAFNLPPILVGLSTDYNRATSDNAWRIAELQTFQPLRKWLMDEVFNNRLLPSIGVHKVRAVLRSPIINDPDEQRNMYDFLARNGILLVKHLLPIAEKVLSTVIDEQDYTEEYLNTPIVQLINSLPPVEGQVTQTDMATLIKSVIRKDKGGDCHL